ncbi:MAG: hypothetical protein WA793_14685, partial [Sphingorhabdus sp.]|uniref:hypothetical protein n=1 Tax=Sphingorhabdus sp. TaxID=1902408 RepID=UPI003C98CBBF
MAALVFADNLRNSTFSVVQTVLEKQLPGGPIAPDVWEPTDLVYQLGDAAGLAFATGRVREGLAIAYSISQMDGGPPRQTFVQTIFAATLGVIAGTLTMTIMDEDVAVIAGERHGYTLLDLSDHGMAQRRYLAELIVPAAFASPNFVDEIEARPFRAFQPRFRVPLLDTFARLSPIIRFVRDWTRERYMDQRLLMAS